jgi:hypothetical protein
LALAAGLVTFSGTGTSSPFIVIMGCSVMFLAQYPKCRAGSGAADPLTGTGR